jgi:DNA invertase Pin-like site-specific DNA recombinase
MMKNPITSAKKTAKNIISVTIDSPYWQQYVRRVNKIKPTVGAVDDKEKIRVVIYARVSTEEQIDGYSLDEQERICREYAASQDWKVLEVIRDEGFSGKNDRRRGYQKLMRLTAKGQVNGVVTHKIDRAYRNLHGMMSTFNTWQEQNVFFASVTERIDFTTTWGKLILAVLSMLAEIFVDNLRLETIKGKRGRFMKGQHNGPAPFGYCRGRCAECDDDNGPGYCYRVGLPNLHHDKHLVPHPIDSLAVQHAFAQYNRGLYTDKQIAEQLNRFTVTTPTGGRVPVRSRGKMGQPPGPFTKDMVRDLLQNPFYTGKVPYYGSEIAGQRVKKFLKPQDINHGLHLPLITEADHNQAIDIRALKGRAPQGKRVRRASHVYVLQGVVECALCGGEMHCQMGSGQTPRLLCSTRIQREGVCDQRSVKSVLLEAELTREVARINLPDDWQEDVIGYLLDEEGLSGLLARRRALDDHFEQIKFLYETEEISRQYYRREWQAYQHESRALDPAGRTDLDLELARKLLGDPARLWSQLTPLERKGLTQAILRVALLDNQTIIEWNWYRPFTTVFA